jgi:hypothetical protein
MMLAVADPPLFSAWQNFYVILGSSAGALTGLQFVVITLIAQRQVAAGMHEVRAFGTPTVVHFCIVLLIAAIASCPWPSMSGPVLALAACGVAGAIYILNAVRHARQANYRPDFEDWIWYSCLPLATYTFLVAAALLLNRHFTFASFLIAAISLVLLILGIHNAWDTVIFIAVQHHGTSDSSESSPSRPESLAR